MTIPRECPKCGGLVEIFSSSTHHALIINRERMIEGVRKTTVSVGICSECSHSITERNEKKIELEVRLPVEFADALAKRLLHYIFHKV